ncbi:MAG: 1-acyl-sn-glycerol-3-phosphate acyltransferase, partial [Bdellovibrionaceae bacterium]|nr:1-acyl-sn-glycerol-3-phosphate acyltransferase [Pseudobdellovibrionaceae bacterium]
FKKTLMTAAGKAGVPIRPFVFNFISVDGGPVKYRHRDSLCWYKDEGFDKIMWRTLQLEKITVEIEFLPLVHVKEDEDRGDLAMRVHGMVSARYKPFYPSM